MSVAEHLGRDTRHRLFMLVYREVQKRVARNRELAKKRGKPVGRGRPPYVAATAEFIGVSRETASRWKNQHYQAMNPNAELVVRKAYQLAPQDTETILRDDLDAHQERLEQFLGEGSKSV